MATLGNMVEEVLLNLEGFGALQDTIASATVGSTNLLTGYADVVLTSPQITQSAGFTPTLLEMGDELMYVVNATFATPSLTCSVLRGYRGTTQEAAASPQFVKVNPRFPKVAVKRAINDTILGLYPRLTAVKTSQINYLSNRFRYDLPADARNIVAVSVQDLGQPTHWHPARYWTFDATGGSASVTGKSIDLRDANPGRPFRVIYTAEPTTLTSNSALFSTTGLPDWAREIVIYGACWRLSSFIDAVSAVGSSAEQMVMNEGQRDAVGRQSTSRYFLGMFETRLAEGEARMQDLYPAPRHYIR